MERRFQIISERSLPDEGEPSGFGCNLCDWTTGETELHLALEKFSEHSTKKHLDTMSARITYIYEKGSKKNNKGSLWRI